METDFKSLSGVIVGLGSIGNRHLKNCLALGVGQMSVVRRAASNSHFSPPEQVYVHHSLSAALATDPDFVIVSNPSHLHAETAIQCLQADTHVLIEKPLGRSFGDAENRLAEMAASSEKLVAMAYCMRYHPAYAKAKEEIEAGSIGNCLYAKAWFEGYLPDWHPWEDYRQSYASLPEQGGGVLRTLDHEMDFLNWVLGPAEAALGDAINTNGIDIKADDLAMYLLFHPNNVTSQVTTSFCRKPQSRGFEFVGKKGTLTFKMEGGQLFLHTNDSNEPSALVDISNYDINQMYIDLMLDFLSTATKQMPSSGVAELAVGISNLGLVEAVSKCGSAST